MALTDEQIISYFKLKDPKFEFDSKNKLRLSLQELYIMDYALYESKIFDEKRSEEELTEKLRDMATRFDMTVKEVESTLDTGLGKLMHQAMKDLKQQID